MAICTLYLISLSSTISHFASSLRKASISPLIAAKVIRWVIPPTVIDVDPLVTKIPKWDVMLVLSGSDSLPQQLDQSISAQWWIKFNMAEEMLSSLLSQNPKLLHPQPSEAPKRGHELDKLKSFGNGASLHSVEISKDDQTWMLDLYEKEGKGAVSMLNLLAFKDRERYMQYSGALHETFGERTGVNPKIIGEAMESSSQSGEVKEWEIVALVHYPSIGHFGDMIASSEYPEISHKYRKGALVDNPVLCTSELAWEEEAEDAKA